MNKRLLPKVVTDVHCGDLTTKEGVTLTTSSVMGVFDDNEVVLYQGSEFAITKLENSRCELTSVTSLELPDLKAQPIKSDGGSSSYYDLEIPAWVVEKILNRKAEDGKYYIKTEECCEIFFGNDFDYSNLFKSSVRSYGTEQGGGKAGNSVDYEMSKVQYSANKIKELSKRR